MYLGIKANPELDVFYTSFDFEKKIPAIFNTHSIYAKFNYLIFKLNREKTF
jgi:hypothetical protein